MMDPKTANTELALAAHYAVLSAQDSGNLDEAMRNLGGILATWLAAHDLRQCDSCGRITDAGDSPDWPNGECEECDPQDTYR